MSLARSRINKDGELLLDARQQRTQERNRADVMDRFVELVRKASIKPKARKRTKPTAASRRRRLEDKKRRGQTKRMRRPVRQSDY